MNNSKFNVVMVDDERDFLEAFKSGLDDQFHVHPFTDPDVALSFLERNSADAVVLDYHIPGSCAWKTFEQLQARDFQKPVMMLTGESNLDIKLQGLERGFDDFLHKPISTQELSAYLRNRIRSFKKRNPHVLKVKNLKMNLQDPQIYVNEQPVMLTSKEFEILRLLVSNPNSVVSKNAILEKVWSNVAVEKNNIDTHMSNLRKKIDGFECQIRTIKKIGYVLRVP